MTSNKFPVEASHIMMFARAIGNESPVYMDASAAQREEAAGIIAPTFVAAAAQFDPDPDDTLRPRPGQPWLGSGRNPSGIDRPDSASGEELCTLSSTMSTTSPCALVMC